MGKIFQFKVLKDGVHTWNSRKPRMRLSANAEGCNEPFKDRFYCPKKKWFTKAPCPFESREDCRNVNSHQKCRGGF